MAELKTDEAVAATIQTALGQIEEAAPMQVEEAADPTGLRDGGGGVAGGGRCVGVRRGSRRTVGGWAGCGWV